MRRVSLTALLIMFWAALSFELTQPFLVVAGVVTALLVARASTRSDLVPDGSPVMHARTVVTYTPWLLWQIIVANVRVILLVWHPKLPIDPRIVEIPCSLKTNLGRAIYANSITLTPGTVTIEVERDKLLIHALTAKDEEGLHEGTMESLIKQLETPA